MDRVLADDRASGSAVYDPVGTEEKRGFDAAAGDAYDMFQAILKIKMITVQVNGNEMAWGVRELLRR